MKYSTNRSLPSSIPPQNPLNATGLTDKTPNNQNKSAISRIAGDFGKISQNSLYFAAHISVIPVQKSDFSGGES
ncbi:hypothetical protein [Microcystis aeruginosa]|jgi:hypothetical protein|uniref:hypothetical protein n=1 Tax=Microcystis aeruginosa TaxID=1126 RepID=UPI0011BF6612|nr:hypothetical protein [Microcystis aeruginosa]